MYKKKRVLDFHILQHISWRIKSVPDCCDTCKSTLRHPSHKCAVYNNFELCTFKISNDLQKTSKNNIMLAKTSYEL